MEFVPDFEFTSGNRKAKITLKKGKRRKKYFKSFLRHLLELETPTSCSPMI
jgi:hypothetical protein